MTRSILCCVSILALATAAAPACAGEQAAKDTRAVRSSAASPPNSTVDDCEARMRKLEAWGAEGEERRAEKNAVSGHCARQYRRDKTIERPVKECAKYEEQPVVKRQLPAECQLAAFNYANALHALKAEYRK